MSSAALGNIDRPESMPVFESVWPSGAAFLQRCSELDDGATAWVQAVRDDDVVLAKAACGALIAVGIHFLDRDMTFNVHAVVVSAAKSGWATLRFLDEERVRRDMVLACAEGQPFPYKRRRHPRLLCHLPAQIRVGYEEQHEAVATDISEGGVRLRMRPQVNRGSRVSLQITLPASRQAVAATGHVTHSEVTASHASVGIAFEFQSSEESAAVARAVQSLKA
jgi:hypothetical protein